MTNDIELPTPLSTKEVLDLIFRDPQTQYSLTEFETLRKPVHGILSIYPKTLTSGKDAGKTKYFLKSFAKFEGGRDEAQVYSKETKGNPEEIIRQLWVYKLINQYGYRADEIVLEKRVYFGEQVFDKPSDIIVYRDNTCRTPKIIFEVKKPKRKQGLDQLKSYLNAEGSPVGVWSNGSDLVILYRPYPREFDDTLSDIPKRGQEPKDVLEAKRTLTNLRTEFNFKKIIQDLEELVLADMGGANEFDEILKLIFAKIWDEKEAEENRPSNVVEFRKTQDPDSTYDRINTLFHKACDEWKGIFRDGEHINLTKRHLQVCIGPIENVRLLGSNLRIMDDAFEYLLPAEAKKKKGQFFTPRHVVEMCVRMLNPKKNEFVLDPACGSGGFLLHTMDWCYPVKSKDERDLRRARYAGKYLWGIDFEAYAAKTSRALMLIAGDGHTNIFGPDVNSLDPTTWYGTSTGQQLMQELRRTNLVSSRIPPNETFKDEDKAWQYFDELKFDVVLANPPFAGEIKERDRLVHYELAKPALKRARNKTPKEERDVLFIERIIRWLKPGGRAAIILPQGKFNNSSLSFIREFILRKGRLLAVVGLDRHTFQPHTGTKTSVVFIQKYTTSELAEIETIKQKVANSCPDYKIQIENLLKQFSDKTDIAENEIPENILELIVETFGTEDDLEQTEVKGGQRSDLETKIVQFEQNVQDLRNQHINLKNAFNQTEEDLRELIEVCKQEAKELKDNWKGSAKDLRAKLRSLNHSYKLKLKDFKDTAQEKAKNLKAEIRSVEGQIWEAETELKQVTNKGKLRIIMDDPELLSILRERFIDAKVWPKLDYQIFMAVSERGGKESSGDYIFKTDKEGNLIEDGNGHLIVDQDLVNFQIGKDTLVDGATSPRENLCIAELFVEVAKKNKFSFWQV